MFLTVLSRLCQTAAVDLTVQIAGDVARRRETSCDVARLLLIVPLEPWQNSTPIFGAAAFCTTKIGDFRASSTSTSLMTWSTIKEEAIEERPAWRD